MLPPNLFFQGTKKPSTRIYQAHLKNNHNEKNTTNQQGTILKANFANIPYQTSYFQPQKTTTKQPASNLTTK